MFDILSYAKSSVSRQARREALRRLAKLLYHSNLSLFDFIVIWWHYSLVNKRSFISFLSRFFGSDW